jgi:dihydroxy-acid dehydratase
VRNGDRIRLSVRERKLDLLVPAEELEQRLRGVPAAAAPARGYASLYHRHVLQADAGCDFDFLRG